MAVSFIQRMVEDAFNIGLSTVKNTATGAGRSVMKGKGWTNRGRDILGAADPRGGMAHGAFDDMVDHWARSNSKWGYAGAAAATPFHVGHMVMGGVGDVVKAGAGVAGTALGTGIGLAGRGAGIAGALALKGGWALTKSVGMPVAKTTAMVGANLAGRTIGATAEIGAAAAKGIWKTRNNPLVGSAIVAGAIGVGATLGNNEFQERAEYGSPDGGRYGTRKGFGYMNTQITGGAWQLNPNYVPNSPQVQELQQRINEQGGYEGIHTAKGPMGDQGGATGDLVFALNQLRQGGLF